MGITPERLGHALLKLELDFQGVLPWRQSGSIPDAKNMCVDCERLVAERGVEDDVCRLAADTGKRFERLATSRHLAAMIADQGFAQSDDVLGLGVEQADGLDRLADLILTQRNHRFGRLHALEQGPSGDIDAGIRRLSGKHDR